MDSGLRNIPRPRNISARLFLLRRQQVCRAEHGGVVRAARSSIIAGCQVDIPLRAYFRISENMGPFERTLIVVEEARSARTIEGCTAPAYAFARCAPQWSGIIIKQDGRVRCTTIKLEKLLLDFSTW